MPATLTQMIVPCDAPFIVPFFAQQTSPPTLLSEGEEAVLHIFNDLYNYHIIFISLFNIFEVPDKYQNLREARAVFRWPSPWEKVGMRLYHISFISLLNTFEESNIIGISEKRGLRFVPLLWRG